MYEDLIFVWEIFCALSSSRSNAEPIKFLEIDAFLNLNGIFNLERRLEVAHLIRIMDEKYLEFMKEKYAKSK